MKRTYSPLQHHAAHAAAKAAVIPALRSPMLWFEQVVDLVIWAAKLVSGTLFLIVSMLFSVWISDNGLTVTSVMEPVYLLSKLLMIPIGVFVDWFRPGSPFVFLWRKTYHEALTQDDPHR